MSKIILLFMLSGITFSASAQHLNAYNYAIGDSVTFINADTTGCTSGNAGTGVSWDFSTLQMVDELGMKIKKPSDVPNGSQFPNASYVKVYSSGEHYFLKNTPASHEMLGATNAQSVSTYPNSQLQLSRPVAHGTQQHDTFTVDGNGGGFNFRGTGYQTISCDGTGTLRLPNATYNNVVRVKQYAVEYDTIFLSPEVTTVSYSTTYLWFDDKHAEPLLRMDSFYVVSPGQDYSFKQVTYVSNTMYTGVEKTKMADKLSCYFQNNSLIADGNFVTGRWYSISIYNAEGKHIMQQGFRASAYSHTLAIDDIPTGMYIVKLTGEDGMAAQAKVVKY